MMNTKQHQNNDRFAKESFSMRRVAPWQPWGIVVFVVVLILAAIYYMYA